MSLKKLPKNKQYKVLEILTGRSFAKPSCRLLLRRPEFVPVYKRSWKTLWLYRHPNGVESVEEEVWVRLHVENICNAARTECKMEWQFKEYKCQHPGETAVLAEIYLLGHLVEVKEIDKFLYETDCICPSYSISV